MKVRIFIATIIVCVLAVGGCLTADFLTTPEEPVFAEDFSTLPTTIKHDPISCDGIKQGAIASKNYGLIASCGENKKMPIASMTKIITALVVVNEKRDRLDDIITLNSDDVKDWEQIVAMHGTNIRIFDGEKLSVRKMLTGMMVASANNIANSLAVHLFSSMDEYFSVARKYLEEHDILDTVVGQDASGFSEQNMSTAKDMVKLGVLAIKDDDLSEIVKHRTVEFPSADSQGAENETERSTTYLHLDQSFVGVKSGYTEDAGYCLTFAKPAASADSDEIVGTIMGGDEGYDYHNVDEFVDNANKRLEPSVIAQAGAKVGNLSYDSRMRHWDFAVQVDKDQKKVLPYDCQLSHESNLYDFDDMPAISISTVCNNERAEFDVSIKSFEKPRGVFR
ncbi:MAG: serine hydrolase [Candidatus Ancillula sp.]|jgi:D-alanyl-D-alanine carboxypeptidase (penicillin-binding protein 5/6)|nr:serine hydrolase [Candidatus Ancillula sp.]